MNERPIIDFYKQRICIGDLYFMTAKENVHFDNICKYVEERFQDYYASEIESDEELIKYIENKYFYEPVKHSNLFYVNFF